MRALGYLVIDTLVEHFDAIREEPAGRKAARGTLEALFREPVPERGTDPRELIEKLKAGVFANQLHVDHPRFFAFVPGPGNFVSTMADALASGFNSFVGTWLGGSGPAEIELVTIDWLRTLCGLPETAGGLFVSGGSMANLTALAIARHTRLGYEIPGAVVYYSDQTHSASERALRVLGFAPAQARKLPSDESFRLPIKALAAGVASDRAQGRRPFCVIANAGTTNTGAIDPLPELAHFCREEGLWLHVDGAYGAAAVISDEGRRLLEGLGEADSLALDPHKWLFQPFEIGCVLLRDKRLMKDALSIHPEYLRDVHRFAEETNFCDYGIQLTRNFRALKLWMSLKTFGLEAFRQAVARGFRLAEAAERRLRTNPVWEIVTPAQMGVVTFRHRSEAANQQLVDAMLADGFALFTSTVLRDRTVLRLCTINPRTTEDEIVATVDRMEFLARSL
jgi:aromatic-L-amino-acid decarboxylase